MSNELGSYPEPALRDYARSGFDAAVSAVPVVGGSLQVLIEAVLVPAVDKRRERWLRQLGEMVEELQARVDGFDPAALGEDEHFVSAVIDASRIAMTTHLEGKLTMLKNCLVNLAMGKSNGDFIDKQMFRWVDELSPEHLIVLEYLRDPRGWYTAKALPEPNLYMGSPMNVLEAAGLPVRGDVLDVVLADLNSRRLIDSGSIGTGMTAQGMWQPLIRPLGQQLLDFIRLV